jgi:hypothetical protein
MALAYVTVILDLYDGSGNYPVSGTASFTPSAVLTDAGVEITGQQPVTVAFRAGSLPSVSLLATDTPGPQPAGWTWGVTFAGITGAPAPFSFFLPSAAASFTAADAGPCVFTVAGAAPLNGTGVQLAGGSLPAGFTAGTTYCVVSSTGTGGTFELAATQGGAALASTSAGSGTVTAVSQLLSNLIPVSAGSTFAAYMPLAGGQFSGAVEPGTAALADGPSIPVDATRGNLFRVTLAGNRTLANPSGGTDGQLIRIEVTQDTAGGRTLSYGTAYDFGQAGPPVLSAAPGAMDVLGLACDAAAARWRLLAFAGGF